MSCHLCGGSQFETVSRRDRRGRPLETHFCTRCGLVSHARIPEQAELDRYYTQDYRIDYHGEATPSAHRVFRAWKNGQRILKQIEPHLPASGEVFEIGAGIGCTVKAFELAGYSASGIEPNRGFQNYSREQLKTRVDFGDWEGLTPVPTYDAVLLIHVIEHLRDPSGALAHIRKLLRDDGFFYVECPNFAAPHAAPGNQFHYAHIFNFSPANLKSLAEKCGFLLVKQFGAANDPNLQMLFRCADRVELEIDPAGVEQARRALSYNWATYHLRPGYIVERIRKLAMYGWERLTGKQRVKEIVATCQADKPAPQAKRKAA